MPSETTTDVDVLLDEILAKGRAPAEKEAPSDEEDKDIDKIKQRKPPSRGLCRRCGENAPINRLMLCYPCWVKTVLEEKGWKEGAPHPSWCNCELSGCGRRSEGN